MIFVFKCIRSFTFFSFLLLVATTIYSIIFTKLLDSIFYPISFIHKVFREKILEQGGEGKNTKNIGNLTSQNPEMVDLIKLCKFLENINEMKKMLQFSMSEIEINYSLMNEIYPELQSNQEKIKYGHFVSTFYYQKGKYQDCWSSIKNIKKILEEEVDKTREEKDNLELEIMNLLSK